MFLKTEIKRNLTSSANILLLLIVMLFGTSGFVKCQENKKSRQTHKLNQTSFSRNSAGKAKKLRNRHYRPGRLIVGFDIAKAAPSSRLTVHAQAGARVEHQFGMIQADVVALPAGKSIHEVMEKYRKIPGVRYVQPDYIYSVSPISAGRAMNSPSGGADKSSTAGVPNDPLFNKQWPLYEREGEDTPSINAMASWGKTRGSADVIVAVIDTGVDYKHEDLKNQMWINTAEKNGSKGVDDDGNGFVDDVYGYDFVNSDGKPMDDAGHGSHCAGIIAAEQNNGVGISGVAPGVRIMALKFLGASGGGFSSDAIKCFEYAKKMGATLTSNSWGGGGDDPALTEAIKAFAKLTVVAAGNDYNNNDEYPFYPANIRTENLIAVFATNSDKEKSMFSNYGKKSVHIGAPGENILSCIPGNKYKKYSGTSMAAPHVAGVAALYLSENPEADPAVVINRIMALGSKKKGFKKLSQSGRIVDAMGIFSSRNTPPLATSAKVAGKARVGRTLKADYDYLDTENDTSSSVKINWYAKDTITGEETLVATNTDSYKPTKEFGDRLVRYEIQLVAKSGFKKGFIRSSTYSEPLTSKFPILYFFGAHSKSSNYVTLGGFAKTNDGSSIINQGLEYFPLSKPADIRSLTYNPVNGDTNQVVTGLKPSTAYKFRLFSESLKGRTYSQYRTIRTSSAQLGSHKLLPLAPARDYITCMKVNIFDNVAVVDEVWNSGTWKVYEYDQTFGGWKYHSRIFPASSDDFVFHVAANNDFLFVSEANSQKLVINKKVRDKWVRHQTLKADTFGSEGIVVTDEEFLVMDHGGGYNSELKVFRRNINTGEWQVHQSLKPPAGRENVYYGSVVAVSGDQMILSESTNNLREDPVTVYFLKRNSKDKKWREVSRYIPKDILKNGQRYSLSISGNYAVVGIPAPFNNFKQGKVLIFERELASGKWNKVQEIKKPSSNGDECFAGQVSFVEDKLFVSYNNSYRTNIICFKQNSSGKYISYPDGLLKGDASSWTFGRDCIQRDNKHLMVGDLNDHEVDTGAGAATIIPISKLK